MYLQVNNLHKNFETKQGSLSCLERYQYDILSKVNLSVRWEPLARVNLPCCGKLLD